MVCGYLVGWGLAQLAKLLQLDKTHSMWELPDYTEIYPGSKLAHFRRLSQKSGIPCHEVDS
jgi:hypothetical protein